MIGLPVATCSSPCLLMISVPEAWQLPRKPGTPVSFLQLVGQLLRERRHVRGK
jgi:hypothetical protein